MNIYEYAMKVEKDGEEYYRNLAEKSTDIGLKRVFTMLADQEVKHYAALKKMARNDGFDSSEYESFDGEEKTIYEILQENKGAGFPESEIAYYKEAIEHEDHMASFYREKAEEASTESEKYILNVIADEEEQHKEIMENILEYIEQPNLVGSAEF